MTDQDSNWERQALERIASAGLIEQRRSRRWGIFFKTLGFLYFSMFLIGIFAIDGGDYGASSTQPHSAMVRLDGIIAEGQSASADQINQALRNAFANEFSKAIIIKINSPGGSPVQSAQINKEIRRLKARHPEKKVYAVVDDICASGGLYVAVAADLIYADESSIVGSIGVRMDGFGFVDAMAKLGVERRLLTAGEHKAMLDPFAPVDSFEKNHLQGLLDSIHEEFIAVVKAGRGDRLVADADLFSGLFWSGRGALELGLIDGLASADEVARNLIEVEDIIDYSIKPSVLDQFAGRVGAALAASLSLVSPQLR
ncbi:MAG: S49 family peptidase [Gammaproteobacteria bacterium]|nr:S49 family peptidase [Gammaproteobacteria bacterium]